MKTRIVQRIGRVAVMDRGATDGFGSWSLTVTARSKRHADRLAALLGWWSYDGGPGREFARLYYSPRRKRLCFSGGLDI